MQIKKYLSYSIILLLLLLGLLIGPMDFFSHGYSCNPLQYTSIPEDAFYNKIDLTQEKYTIHFSPRQNHFAGFEIYFEDLSQNITGEIYVSLKNSAGKEIGC